MDEHSDRCQEAGTDRQIIIRIGNASRDVLQLGQLMAFRRSFEGGDKISAPTRAQVRAASD